MMEPAFSGIFSFFLIPPLLDTLSIVDAFQWEEPPLRQVDPLLK